MLDLISILYANFFFHNYFPSFKKGAATSKPADQESQFFSNMTALNQDLNARALSSDIVRPAI